MTDPLGPRPARGTCAPARELKPTTTRWRACSALDAARGPRPPAPRARDEARGSRRPGRWPSWSAPAPTPCHATRAAIDDVYGAMTDWIASDDPGRRRQARALGPAGGRARLGRRNASGVQAPGSPRTAARKELYAFQESDGQQPQRRARLRRWGSPRQRGRLAPPARRAQGRRARAGGVPRPVTETTGRPLDAHDSASALRPHRQERSTRVELPLRDRRRADDQARPERRLRPARRCPSPACARSSVPYDDAGREIERIHASRYGPARCTRGARLPAGPLRAGRHGRPVLAGARGVAERLRGALRGADPHDRGLVRDRVERGVRGRARSGGLMSSGSRRRGHRRAARWRRPGRRLVVARLGQRRGDDECGAGAVDRHVADRGAGRQRLRRAEARRAGRRRRDPRRIDMREARAGDPDEATVAVPSGAIAAATSPAGRLDALAALELRGAVNACGRSRARRRARSTACRPPRRRPACPRRRPSGRPARPRRRSR